MRTMKIEMISKNDKDIVMSNFKRLKGTENELGKISITDDYANGERDLIKIWVKKAAEKSAQDSNYVYRVRGNPKNGLRLVSFTRENLNSS